MRTFFKNTCLFCLIAFSVMSFAVNDELNDIVVGDHRSQNNIDRNKYRNPVKTLQFFKVEPQMTVVEIWPGGSAWYTEILAPYLRDKGKLYLADFVDNPNSNYVVKAKKSLRDKLKANASIYKNVVLTEFNPSGGSEIAPEGTVDRVLTFRNAHNWYMRGGGEEKLLSAMKTFYKALKPGGILGVVDHRLPEGRPNKNQEASGYIKESVVINIAKKAGFKLDQSSNVNSNAKDTADYPGGVWTLPPSLSSNEKDKKKYLKIGESDRMTLRFVKPKM